MKQEPDSSGNPGEQKPGISIASILGLSVFLGLIVGAGAGVYQGCWVTLNKGVLLPTEDRTVEGVAAAWPRIDDRSDDLVFRTASVQTETTFELLGMKRG